MNFLWNYCNVQIYLDKKVKITVKKIHLETKTRLIAFPVLNCHPPPPPPSDSVRIMPPVLVPEESLKCQSVGAITLESYHHWLTKTLLATCSPSDDTQILSHHSFRLDDPKLFSLV